MRSRLRLQGTAAAVARELGDRLAERPRARRTTRHLPARGPRRAGPLPTHRLVRARDAAGNAGRPLQRAVCGALVLVALSLAGCGGDDEETNARTTTGGSPAPEQTGFLVGAVDDSMRERGPRLDQLRDAGFGAVGITSRWEPGLAAPTREELAVLKGVAARAKGVRIFLSVYNAGSSTTPLTSEARRQFASYVAAVVREVAAIRDVIVGNEPNLNRFRLPQFESDGGDAAAPAYFALLIASYDAAKKVDEDVRIWGGALAPRGIDRPGTGRDTQSPTRFIRDLGAAYRASGRREPPLDGFAFHPYPESSSIPPVEPTNPASTAIGLADDKLRPLLKDAFGAELPILYS